MYNNSIALIDEAGLNAMSKKVKFIERSSPFLEKVLHTFCEAQTWNSYILEGMAVWHAFDVKMTGKKVKLIIFHKNTSPCCIQTQNLLVSRNYTAYATEIDIQIWQSI